MGYTIPEAVDTMLDVVGVGRPNAGEAARHGTCEDAHEVRRSPSAPPGRLGNDVITS
ncbi:hypothetical protein ACGFZC_04280 [[Kitasatospora] papulosa]|uniref:hypothetical protein n=1 Tax=Streptomyces TaxID=1883 RepID=UPI0025B4736A|nr:hypothetical protein [Streptomyces sp. P9-2B-1]WJY34214.1 hypothetical protein QTO28_25750 [Streptomyces sp. P9-2B-1]